MIVPGRRAGHLIQHCVQPKSRQRDIAEGLQIISLGIRPKPRQRGIAEWLAECHVWFGQRDACQLKDILRTFVGQGQSKLPNCAQIVPIDVQKRTCGISEMQNSTCVQPQKCRWQLSVVSRSSLLIIRFSVFVSSCLAV